MGSKTGGWVVERGRFEFRGTPYQERPTAQTEPILEFIRDARGDPRLSAWEEAFLANLQAQISEHRAGILSRKQLDMLGLISESLTFRPTLYPARESCPG